MTSIAPPCSFNRTSPPVTVGGGLPLPFAPILGSRPVSRTSAPGNRITTPLAAPPPPLNLTANPASTNQGRKIRYAGAEHTLGPTFSEEEDGDDSEWIANKMAVLGLDPQGLPYSNGLAQQTALRDSHSRARARAQAQAQAQYDARVQQQQQQFQNQQRVQLQSQAQQQQLIQAILIAQETGQATHQYREALAAQAQQAITVNSRLQAQGQLVLQAQAERALFATQLQQQQQRQQYQQQLYPYREQQTQIPAYTEDRSVLAAQVQANLQAQTNRNHSPFGDAMWKSHAPQSRQAQSAYETQTRSTPTSFSRFSTSQGDSISTFLARRRATDESSRSSESEATLISIDTAIVSRADTAQTSPNPSISEKEHEKVTAQAVLGNGRPGPLLPTSRVWTTPAQSTNKAGDSPTPRSASHPGGNARTIVPLRQPTGPPGEAKELGEKNFQSRLRRQAGLKLGMLGRRNETPIVAPLIG